jgi:hypothetical protein
VPLLHAQSAVNPDASAVIASGTGATQNISCSVLSLQSAASLTFKQRNCFFARQVFSPVFAVSTIGLAAMDQARNSPRMHHETWGMFPRRVATFYARVGARDSAEMLVGYWHHEDPRPRKSLETGFWRRTNAAMLSVITSPDADGHLRPAFGPVAGSLSSALVGTALYRHSEALPTTMIHAGAVYGFYFVRAVFAEFKPEMDSMIRRVLNR